MGGPDPPDPPPGSATALVPFDILSTALGINLNTPIAIDARSELEIQSL